MTQQPPLGAGTAALTLPTRALLTSALLAAAATMASVQSANATCRIQASGAKCETTALFQQASPGSSPLLPVAIGEPLPWDYMVLLNSEYFGLPPVEDGWVYFRVKGRVVRADYATREVLEDVTSQTNRAFF
ncbi:hypothetical protein [Vannielia litorea]|uniref:hypothetical protein n=1 Tax=Vannielia litorea TaxID=1217970 RepID=UPI001BCF76D9|nr:hypothetical protein [Vannielia litorea]MBS8228567.1 hypothetical protein [Vannielia litorea]